MTYQITYTKRFEKHLKALSKTEKNQLILLLDVGHHDILNKY